MTLSSVWFGKDLKGAIKSGGGILLPFSFPMPPSHASKMTAPRCEPKMSRMPALRSLSSSPTLNRTCFSA